MKVINLTSDQLRKMVADKLGRDVDDVGETGRDDGMMASWIDAGHDSVPIYVPIVRFLSAYYDVSTVNVGIFFNPYEWTYRAEVSVNA